MLRSVTDEVVVTSLPTTVSFALACRSLEDPTLRSLWEQQESLNCLTRVLSSCTMVEGEDSDDVIVSGYHFPSSALYPIPTPPDV